MDFSDLLEQQPIDQNSLSNLQCQPATKDEPWKNWQRNRFRSPSVYHPHMRSSPRSLKRSSFAALSRSNSLASIAGEFSTRLVRDEVKGAGHLLEKARVPSASFAGPCHPSIRKIRHKGVLRRSSSSTRLRSGYDEGLLFFCSSGPCYNNDDRVVNPCGSPFSLNSSVQSLSNDETGHLCSSPTVSITTEHHLYRSGSSSFQSFSDEELHLPYGSFKSFNSTDDVYSAQSEFFCSDGSISSEVIGTPEDYSDLNRLMESMLNDINEGGFVQEPGERHPSFPIEIPIGSRGSLPSVDNSPVGESIGCISPGEVTRKNTRGLFQVDGSHELETSALPDFHVDQMEGQRGMGGLSAEIRSWQEAGVWKRPNGACIVASSEESLAQEIGVASNVVSPKDQSVHNSEALDDVYWMPESVLFTEEHHNFSGAQPTDLLPAFKRSQKHDARHNECAEMFSNPAFSFDNCQMEGIDELCQSFETDVPHLPSSSIEDPKNPMVSQLAKIEDALSKGESRSSEKTIDPQLLQQQGGIRSDADYNGIRLVHLLIAGAEAVASRDMDLASVILVRLRELVSRSGSTMQRVAAYFSDGLQCRIEGGRILDREGNIESESDTLAAFQILHEISPYIKFGHFTANQSILEAVEGEKKVHIVDYDIMEGIQWPSLMQALVLRKEGPPHLRITALCRPHAKRGLSTVQETCRRLTEFAASLNLPFTFNQVRIDNEEEFRPSVLKIIKGEALVVNCMLHLPHMPHRTATSVASFLQGMRKFSPALLTLVEDELGCNTPAFTSHFFEALHHYSAMFDSLEASLSSEAMARALVERVFLAPRITSTVTFCGSIRPETGVEFPRRNWSSLLSAAGFKPVPLSIHNLCQARVLLSLFKDGFKLDEDCNRLLLGWRSKPLVAASVWNCE